MGIIIKQSILSGILVGLGVVINIESPLSYVGAMLFSIALLVIIECNLKLYTGKIGYIDSIPTKDLLIMLIGNLIGIIIPVIAQYGVTSDQLFAISVVKFSKDYFELFLDGFMCGTLMFIAVYCKKYLITVFCIMTFILSGYEHCVADFPFLLVNFSLNNLIKFVLIVIGNSIGSICVNKLIKSTGE